LLAYGGVLEALGHVGKESGCWVAGQYKPVVRAIGSRFPRPAAGFRIAALFFAAGMRA
jgi:hypothetical protein